MAVNSTRLRLAIESTFEVVRSRSTGDELVIICPGCRGVDASGNRSINLKTGKTNCWKCNVGGSVYAWAKRAGYDLDIGDAPAPSTDELDGMMLEITVHQPTSSSYVPSVKLPRGFIPVAEQPRSAYAEMIAEMAERKKLTFEDMVTAGVGFTRQDPRWEPFAVFPVDEWSRPVYYQGRTYNDPERDPVTGKKPSTKQFPSRHECPLGSRHWLYGIDELRAAPGAKAVIVESILNVLSLRKELTRRGIGGVVPLAVFKHAISPEQQRKLLAAKPGEICLMFDGDATASAFKDAGYLSNSCKVSVAEMPIGTDPNDDAVLAVDRFLARQPYSRFHGLSI